MVPEGCGTAAFLDWAGASGLLGCNCCACCGTVVDGEIVSSSWVLSSLISRIACIILFNVASSLRRRQIQIYNNRT
jgi:hypothetical protein